ncbi:MAG: hypothetical protein IM473_11855 [Microcystis sp. M015S2]|nr:hypothetical protein [Microcystis sp. M025S2]MCA2743078.1 hypothetical protein [Microcystis sp. M015S2]MCA2759056.1 hypothetical protein [Microcystis sp. M145S2]
MLEAIMKLNISLEAPEKITEEIRQRKEAIDRQSAEFNQWMNGIKARLDAIAKRSNGTKTLK